MAPQARYRTAARTRLRTTPRSGIGGGVDLYVNSLAELNALFVANSIPSDGWDLIWPELGYSSAGDADDAMYSTGAYAGGQGILKQDILDAWAAVNASFSFDSTSITFDSTVETFDTVPA